jgi:hypothetical protein
MSIMQIDCGIVFNDIFLLLVAIVTFHLLQWLCPVLSCDASFHPNITTLMSAAIVDDASSDMRLLMIAQVFLGMDERIV